MRWFILWSTALMVWLCSVPAWAQYANALTGDVATLTAYMQHGQDGIDEDWHCGTQTYSRPGYAHQGTDLAIGWVEPGISFPHVQVHAGVRGEVVAAYTDCADVCQTGDCICANASGAGNFVKVADRFGRTRTFMHMRRGSVQVRPGDKVEADSILGEVGSSGFSTGPHLHDEFRDEDDVVEPFAGDCASDDDYLKQVSIWNEQGNYRGLPSDDAYTCEIEPGRYADGYHDAASRHAFQHAYGYRGYAPKVEGVASPSLGCPQTPDGTVSYVHDVAGVEVQDFVQTDASRRFAGSDDGHTALIRAPGAERAHLLHSGFWGAYKCLPMNIDVDHGYTFGSMGGTVWLGAAVDDEHHPNQAECPECKDDLVAVRQNFERGYLSYRSDGVIRLHLPGIDSATEAALARSVQDCGAQLHVQGNPPTGPEACTSDGKPIMTFIWNSPPGLDLLHVEVWGSSAHPEQPWSYLGTLGMAGSTDRWVCSLPFDAGSGLTFNIRYRTATVEEAWVFDASCSEQGGCGQPVGEVEVYQGEMPTPFTLAWNGYGPKDPPIYLNGVIDALTCPTSPRIDPQALVIHWLPPEAYRHMPLIATVQSWIDGVAHDVCVMQTLDDGERICQLDPDVGASVLFTIAFEGAQVPGGIGYVFDQSTSPSGGCVGHAEGCGQNNGTVTITKGELDISYDLAWNGQGPLEPLLYFNAHIAHVP